MRVRSAVPLGLAAGRRANVAVVQTVTPRLSREGLSPHLGARLREANVLVLPGFPNRSIAKPETGEDVYPSGTGHLLKLLREGGASAEYADSASPRVQIALKAAEYWIPILLVLRDVFVSAEGALLVDAIREWTGREKKAILHVNVGCVDTENAIIEWFSADGAGDEVLDALRAFCERE